VRLADGKVTGSLPGRDVRGSTAYFAWNTWALVGDGRAVWGCAADGTGCVSRSVATGERLSALPDGVVSGPSPEGRFVVRSGGGACLASAGSSDCKDFPPEVARASWRWTDGGRWLWSIVQGSTSVWTADGDRVATFPPTATEVAPGLVSERRARAFAVTRLADRAIVQFEIGGVGWLARAGNGVFEAPVLDGISVRGDALLAPLRDVGPDELRWRSTELVSRLFAGRPLPAAPEGR
jgi:hypothetical protein